MKFQVSLSHCIVYLDTRYVILNIILNHDSMNRQTPFKCFYTFEVGMLNNFAIAHIIYEDERLMY